MCQNELVVLQLDSKNSPLALLAQTCNSIGREIAPSRPTAPSGIDKQPLVSQPLSSTRLLSPDVTIPKSSSSTSLYINASIAASRLGQFTYTQTPDSSSRTQNSFSSHNEDEGSIINQIASATRLESTECGGSSRNWRTLDLNHRSGTGVEANPSRLTSAFTHIKKGVPFLGGSYPQELVGTANGDALAKYHDLRTLSEVTHANPDPLQILSLLGSSLAKNLVAYSTYPHHQQPHSSSSFDDLTANFSLPDYHHVLTDKLLSSLHPAAHCFGSSGSASVIAPEGKFLSSLSPYLALAGAAESGTASGSGLLMPCADPSCVQCRLALLRESSNHVPGCNVLQSKMSDASLRSSGGGGGSVFTVGPPPFIPSELLSASWLQSVLASFPASGMLTSYLQALAFLHPSVLTGILEPMASHGHRKLFCSEPAQGSASVELTRDGSASSSTFVCPLVVGGGGGGDLCQRRFHSWEELLQHLKMSHHSSNASHMDDVRCSAPRESPGYSASLSSYATPPSYSSTSSPSSQSSALHPRVAEIPGFAMRTLSPKPDPHSGYDHRRATTRSSLLNRMIGRYHPYNPSPHPEASSHSPHAASKPSLSYPSALHCPSRPYLGATALS